MAESRIWTPEELLALSPDQRDQVIRDGVLTDPEKIPSAVIERARLKADGRISASESGDRAR